MDLQFVKPPPMIWKQKEAKNWAKHLDEFTSQHKDDKELADDKILFGLGHSFF